MPGARNARRSKEDVARMRAMARQPASTLAGSRTSDLRAMGLVGKPG